jgi:hypothetical protein
MDVLVASLKALEASALPDGDDDVRLHQDDHELVSTIEGLATDLLITSEGTPDFAEIDRLYHEHGYFIFPGERDRFGWLTACLRTTKGVIAFG